MNKREEYERVLNKFEDTNSSNIITPSLVAPAIGVRPKNIHKGNCGRLLVLAGSVGMTGAAILASKASIRCGCGLVTLACARELNTIFEIALTEVMTLPLNCENGAVTSDALSAILQKTSSADALVIGPGLSVTSHTKNLVAGLIKKSNVPIVLDADGINAVSENVDVLKGAGNSLVLTPHIGEFSRLISVSTEEILKNKEKYAKDFAKEYGVTLVLKSHKTIVALPSGDLYFNILGNPGMAKGGSGDVLAGCIASFLAQTHDARLSALSGVYFHSLAADMAVLETGEYSLLPTDILDYLKYAIKETYDDINKN